MEIRYMRAAATVRLGDLHSGAAFQYEGDSHLYMRTSYRMQISVIRLSDGDLNVGVSGDTRVYHCHDAIISHGK